MYFANDDKSCLTVFGYRIFPDMVRDYSTISDMLEQAPKMKEAFYKAWQALCESTMGKHDLESVYALVCSIVCRNEFSSAASFESYPFSSFLCHTLKEIAGYELAWLGDDEELVIGIEPLFGWWMDEKAPLMTEDEACTIVNIVADLLPEKAIENECPEYIAQIV